jgi:hypothetical protein
MAKWTYFGCLKQFQRLAKIYDNDGWHDAAFPQYSPDVTIRAFLKMLRQHYPNRLFKSRWGYEPDSAWDWIPPQQLCIYYKEK